ncbi:uncharacterized protein LOC114751900 [Neltuma alba]|uniref:uncharacterized protein LOC114751900 n=1 Tax=Neltuma alba TaxID=207710 RepID=UPI0010A32FEE|nr:uncharacterized protein LOC114751900 [Prosopis alba]
MAILFMVARTGIITKPKLLHLRGKSELSKDARRLKKGTRLQEEAVKRKMAEVAEEEGRWVPHPRTGIFVPKGQEWVMKDVPESAATFTLTCWFRNDHDLNHPNF